MIVPAESPQSAQPSAASTYTSRVAAQLETLPNLSMAELRAEWRRRFRSPPPNRLSRDLLTRGIVYKIQERAHGGLSRVTLRKLQALAGQVAASNAGWLDPYPSLKPGTRLVRSWRGETHSVLVLDEGFEYRGARFRSLSQIARMITSARWSGPRFFGLKRRSEPFARSGEAAHG
jgi:hypothetical protein